jgi:adenylate kinase
VALNVVFLGPPAAGKGTQAERFAREHGIPKISTGDILREAVAADTPLGREVKAVMARGGLVSDDLIVAIVKERLARPDTKAGFVLDGFPRTVPQAVALDAMLVDRDPLVVVEIQVPDDELVRRAMARRICSQCGRTVSVSNGADGASERCASCGGRLVLRADDTEPVMRDRLKVYWRETQPMIGFYQARPTYCVVNGAETPDRVRDELAKVVAGVTGQSAAPRQPAGAPGPEKHA